MAKYIHLLLGLLIVGCCSLPNKKCEGTLDCDIESVCLGKELCEEVTGKCHSLGKECVRKDQMGEYLEKLTERENQKNQLFSVIERMRLTEGEKNRRKGFSIVSKIDADAAVRFRKAKDSFSMGIVGEHGDFVISKNREPVLLVQGNGNVGIKAKRVVTKDLLVEGAMFFKQNRQWYAWKEEIFTESGVDTVSGQIKEGFGWTYGEVTRCGGVSMLGGYCKLSTNVSKEFTAIPSHSFIRVEASLHYIDQWQGEAAFLKIGNSPRNLEYVFTDFYDGSKAQNGLNICGTPFPESRFQTLVDIMVPHSESSVILFFGTNLEKEPCTASFGISVVRISLR